MGWRIWNIIWLFIRKSLMMRFRKYHKKYRI